MQRNRVLTLFYQPNPPYDCDLAVTKLPKWSTNLDKTDPKIHVVTFIINFYCPFMDKIQNRSVCLQFAIFELNSTKRSSTYVYAPGKVHIMGDVDVGLALIIVIDMPSNTTI